MRMIDDRPDPFDRPLRVLIAEDETIIRLDLKLLLEDNGFAVCGEARDGIEAVELARETKPDVGVFDLRMPRLDGIEAARRVYAERPVPIVLLTAYHERALVDRAVAAGVFTYLVKPFRSEDVVPALHAAVARHDELLDARRDLGRRGGAPIELDVHAAGGRVWPLRIQRRADGSVEVKLAEPDEEA
jgi:AmiR/NasT family two-component response regulator